MNKTTEALKLMMEALEMQIHGAGSIIHSKLAWQAGSEALANHSGDANEMVHGYDLSNVIHLTHNKAQHIIQRDSYVVTGFVLTKNKELEHYSKCIVDMSAVRWFDDGMTFFRMMHSDTPKEWLSPPVVKQPVNIEPSSFEREEALVAQRREFMRNH